MGSCSCLARTSKLSILHTIVMFCILHWWEHALFFRILTPAFFLKFLTYEYPHRKNFNVIFCYLLTINWSRNYTIKPLFVKFSPYYYLRQFLVINIEGNKYDFTFCKTLLKYFQYCFLRKNHLLRRHPIFLNSDPLISVVFKS